MMPSRRIEPEGERQQQRHAGERPEPGHHADDGAPQATDEAVEQPLPGERDRETAEELVEARHRRLRTGPSGAARRAVPGRQSQHAAMPSHGPDDREQQRNARDEHEQRGGEQAERHVGAERLEQQRHRQQGREGDQHVRVTELDRLAFARRAPAADADHDREQDHERAEQQREEARPWQSDAAEVEQRGLPDEEEPGRGERSGGQDRRRGGRRSAKRKNQRGCARSACARILAIGDLIGHRARPLRNSSGRSPSRTMSAAGWSSSPQRYFLLHAAHGRISLSLLQAELGHHLSELRIVAGDQLAEVLGS